MQSRVLSTIFTACALLATPVMAADYGSPANSVMTPVEFGSGWYLRGDISWNIHGKMESGANYIDLVGEHVVYTYDDAIALRAGAGFQINPNLRIEATAEYLMRSSFENTLVANFGGSRRIDWPNGPDSTVIETVYFNRGGTVTGTNLGLFTGTSVTPIGGTEEVDVSYSGQAFMLNAYFDLPTVGWLTPYVGGGGGIGRMNYSEKRTLTCNSGTDETCESFVNTDFTETYYAPAWQLSAGAAVAINDKLSLDIGYNHLSIGGGQEIDYGNGAAMETDGVSIHQIRAGLRYQIW